MTSSFMMSITSHLKMCHLCQKALKATNAWFCRLKTGLQYHAHAPRLPVTDHGPVESSKCDRKHVMFQFLMSSLVYFISFYNLVILHTFSFYCCSTFYLLLSLFIFNRPLIVFCRNHRSSFHAVISYNSLVMFIVEEKGTKTIRISLSKDVDAAWCINFHAF
jgi:hypothetical protein